MGWQVEQNTGTADQAIRCVWWKGHIYAFTEDLGVWRRDGVGPWTQVFIHGNNGGQAWLWEADDAIYCGGGALNGNHIYRSVDGDNWTLDVDLNAAFGLQGWYHNYSEIGGYGNYLYVANHDVGGAGATYFYRRDLAGNWVHHSTHAGAEGASGRGIVGFGNEIYWTNSSNARYWDGAAWSIESTLDAQGGTYLSVIGGILYVLTSTLFSLVGGYYWKTPAATTWSFMDMPLPDNTWGGWTLCRGADGNSYAIAQDGNALRIYRQVGEALKLVAYQATVAPNLGTRGGVCVDSAGNMYFGTRAGGTVRFFAFVPDHDLTPIGNGLYPQSLDVDGDGDRIYVAAYDAAGQPLLIRAELPLTVGSVGSAMFDPGAGSAINVRCINVGGRLAVSGRFSAGGNDSVQVSEDAGLTWTDIAPNWGDTAQPLLVDADTVDQVTVALDTAQDLVETFDGGATPWLTRNAAVGYSPGAMARLEGGDELVVGDDAANRIDFSPNRGQRLHNITGAFVGFCQALEVV